MAPYFLPFLLFVLCALISPLILASVVGMFFSSRWRPMAQQAAKAGIAAAVAFLAFHEMMLATLASARTGSIGDVIAAGGGFTVGVAGSYLFAWVWKKRPRLR
jgi:uncharacterized membrane protein